MNQPVIQFRFLNASRQLLAIPDPLKWEYTLQVNKPGGFSVTLGIDDFPREVLTQASRVAVWRRDTSGEPFRWESEYLVRKPIEKRDKDGRRVMTLGGSDVGILQLLKSRIIHAAKGTTYADKMGFVTDIMRAYVREQCTTSAGSDRAFYETLTVQADTREGPVISKEAAQANILDTLQALVKAAAEPGTYQANIYFNLTPLGDGWLFYVKTGQLGAYRGLYSSAPTVLLGDVDFEEWEYERNAEKEITSVFVGGKESYGVQPVIEVKDTTRLRNPVGNRWEAWHNASNESDTQKMRTEGAKKLDEGTPLDRQRGTLVQGVYGRRVFFGDRVVIQRGLDLREARMEALTVTGDGGRVTDKVRLES